MVFDLKSLELFQRVSALGAIGRAGAEFGLSPTAATQRIQALEEELGVKLFNRTTRAVALTPDGELLLDHARTILEAAEDARTALSASHENVSGLLRVTASASFGRTQIVPHVGEFLDLHPNISLSLYLSDTIVDIVDQGFDLAIRVGTLTSSSLLARKLADNPRVLVASPSYLKRAGDVMTPKDLKSHSCIVLGSTGNWTLQKDAEQDIKVRVSGAFTTNYGEAVTDAVLQGVGIGLKSLWDVSQNLASGRMTRVLPDYRILPDWKIWAVRPPHRVVPARVKAFTHFLEGKFKGNDLI
ncbi:LysR family transcriptional regulator (plasmid) [Phaeobacter inhibens]|uniref:LysR family transcriptional regulator n=1 Tax=Phaeobacter inhibens TaxID=221822 RepID=UPI000971B378|nr:LysR family transcriptional regulator [Phaeobacter inhibens]APX18017.1 LysR family transcriptional regulator [Phaeobacter inhibens]